jgi:hypothetical protein
MKKKERMTKLVDDGARFMSENAGCPRNLYGFRLQFWQRRLSGAHIADRLPEVRSGLRQSADRKLKMKVHPAICMKTNGDNKFAG